MYTGVPPSVAGVYGWGNTAVFRVRWYLMPYMHGYHPSKNDRKSTPQAPLGACRGRGRGSGKAGRQASSSGGIHDCELAADRVDADRGDAGGDAFKISRKR